MTRRVILVAGPPCAGKTTHVRQHAVPGDLVLDQDRIGTAAMNRGLAHIAAMTHGTAWVIRCAPGPRRRAELARRIRATDVLLLRPDRGELMARANQRPHPRQHVSAILSWLATEQRNPPASSHRAQPSTTATTTQRGLGWAHQQERTRQLNALRDGTPCPRCHHPMTRRQQLDLDDWPGRVFGGPQVKRLAHAGCNRSAGAQLGNTLRAARRPQRIVHSRRW